MAMLVFYNGSNPDDLTKHIEKLEYENSQLINNIRSLENDKKKLVDDITLYKKVQSFYDSLKDLDKRSKYFFYNKDYRRIECKIDGEIFPQHKAVILENKKEDLLKAGKELNMILDNLNQRFSIEDTDKADIGVKIIIDGRAAKHIDKPKDLWEDKPIETANLTYNRSKALYEFWKLNGILQDIEKKSEIFCSGSGYGGKGRYSGSEELKNKRFIIEIIPFIKY